MTEFDFIWTVRVAFTLGFLTGAAFIWLAGWLGGREERNSADE